MADFFDALGDDHVAMIGASRCSSSPPRRRGARINLSPKGSTASACWRRPGRLSRPRRFGQRDQRASARRRADHADVLQFPAAGADPADLRPRRAGACRGTAVGGARARISRCCPARARSSTSRSRASRPAAAGACR